jgi:hypothetical protein
MTSTDQTSVKAEAGSSFVGGRSGLRVAIKGQLFFPLVVRPCLASTLGAAARLVGFIAGRRARQGGASIGAQASERDGEQASANVAFLAVRRGGCAASELLDELGDVECGHVGAQCL